MLTMDVYHFSPPSSYTTLQPIVQSEPEEDQLEVQPCCHSRVVEFAEDLIEIADDERSSSSESSSSDDDVPELESLSDRENIQPILVPAPLDIPPPYAMSGQHAVCSKGIPKSIFHPYPCDHQPLAHIFEHAKAETGGFNDGPPLWRTTPTSPSYSPGGYGVVHSGSDGEDQHRSPGGTGSFLLYLRSGGDCDVAREELQSSFDSAI